MSSEMGSTSASSSSTPTKRACDSCHRRKVKCIGEGLKPCKNCVSAGLACTFNAIPQKKGPKGSRAKVLSELRGNQRQSQLASSLYDRGFGARAISPARAKTPGLLTIEVIDSCVDFFFANLYAVQPVLHRQQIQHAVVNWDHSVESYCLLAALCAYVLLQPQMILPPTVAVRNESGATSNQQLAYMVLEESIRVRRNYDYIENPTLLSVYTSFFIFQCYFCLEKQNAAWCYLRQATTIAHILGMHDEETYKPGDVIECSRKRRLFWLLFIIERSYAFKRHRPLTLHATIHIPSVNDDPSDTLPLSGLIHLINLYKSFDETFFGLWNRTATGVVPSWLAQLQKQLSDALPAYIESTELQTVDLQMSQLWLKTMVWQLAISHGFISSMTNDNTLSFRYPIHICRQLVDLSNEFSQHAMDIHGIGLVEKLFDIACTLTDVIATVPASNLTQQGGYEQEPRGYLNRLVQLLAGFRGGQSRYLPLLLNKVHSVLPNHNIPSSALRSFDIAQDQGDYYAASTSSTSQEATPFQSPPLQQHPAGPLSLRPGPSQSSVIPGHTASTYSGHYETTASHVQGLSLGYPVYQASVGYPDLLNSAQQQQQGQNAHDTTAAIYPNPLPPGGHGGVGRGGVGYGE